MKFFVTMPALPGKYFEVDSKSEIFAALDATRLTVWTEEKWKATQDGWKDTPFPPLQRIDSSGRFY